jgi:hypothetical protein
LPFTIARNANLLPVWRAERRAAYIHVRHQLTRRLAAIDIDELQATVSIQPMDDRKVSAIRRPVGPRGILDERL